MSVQFWLADPDGVARVPLRPLAYRYRKVLNGLGYLVLAVRYDEQLCLRLVADARLEVWRTTEALGGPYLDGGAVWLVRYVAVKRIGNAQIIEVGCLGANELLRRRIVAYNSEAAQASKSGPADDVMKAIVRENFVSATDATRNWSHFTVASDVGAAPTVAKSIAWRSVLPVLQEIAQTSTESGTRLYFDVTGGARGAGFVFRTYTYSRGDDRSFPGGTRAVTFSPEWGTLDAALRSDDWSDEVTAVYCGGRGVGSDRLIVQATDRQRIGASPFGRREAWNPAAPASTPDTVTDEAYSRLRDGQPRRSFRGRIVSQPGCIYGVHWGLGDLVSVAFAGEVAAAEVHAVTTSGQGSTEQITAELRGIV